MKTRGWAVPLALLLSLVIPGVGATDDSVENAQIILSAFEGGASPKISARLVGMTQGQLMKWEDPLVKALRASVMNSFRDMAPPGYVPDPYCASGADGGAVGIHFVNGALIDDVLNAAEPEVLYYEPLPGGRIRLVGAEYAYFEVPFGTPPVTPQHLEGHLLHYMVAPNRFGIPFDWLRLNVWAWKRNPNGTFAGDNPNVSCDHYDPNLHPQP